MAARVQSGRARTRESPPGGHARRDSRFGPNVGVSAGRRNCHSRNHSRNHSHNHSLQGLHSRNHSLHGVHAAAAPAESSVVRTDAHEVEIRYGISSAQGPRETMEDVAYAVPEGPCGLFYCSVLDGHAGVASARYLEEHLFDTIYQAFKEDAQNSSCAVENLDEEGLCCPIGLTSIMTSSYQRADAELLQWLKKQPGPEKDSGCTATSVLVDQYRIVVANVGDSRAVLSRTSGHVDLSVEHRVFGGGDVVVREAKRIEASGGLGGRRAGVRYPGSFQGVWRRGVQGRGSEEDARGRGAGRIFYG